jgi:hypothetical protein
MMLHPVKGVIWNPWVLVWPRLPDDMLAEAAPEGEVRHPLQNSEPEPVSKPTLINIQVSQWSYGSLVGGHIGRQHI